MMDHREMSSRCPCSERRATRPGDMWPIIASQSVQQGRFGFSIEAQRAAVEDYVAANPGVIVAEFSEVMSGRKDSRPELAKALSLCRIARAVLVIARLDRLSRNVEMVARLRRAD